MRRKLIQHGLSSLTISLPRKWVKENNLKKGEEIELEIFKGKLVVSTKKHYEYKKIEINVSNAQPMIRRIVGATFKTGYDEVSVKFNTYQELKAVQDLVREQFTGFEIISQTENRIIIKNLSQTDFIEFNNVLRRFFFVLNQMASELGEALKKDDLERLKNTTLFKIESDKCADYCRRAINMDFESDFKRTAPLYTIIEQLEKVVDRYKDLCMHISTNKIKTNNKIQAVTKNVIKFQKEFYDLFYKFEIGKTIELGRNKEILQKKLDDIATQCSKKERKIVIFLDRILNLIFDLNGPLMAVYLKNSDT
ncbi:MAG: AbrB/MazE/SpoVT family DNA-binding domain-containing protein [Nanoarchaeota archaeon]